MLADAGNGGGGGVRTDLLEVVLVLLVVRHGCGSVGGGREGEGAEESGRESLDEKEESDGQQKNSHHEQISISESFVGHLSGHPRPIPARPFPICPLPGRARRRS